MPHSHCRQAGSQDNGIQGRPGTPVKFNSQKAAGTVLTEAGGASSTIAQSSSSEKSTAHPPVHTQDVLQLNVAGPVRKLKESSSSESVAKTPPEEGRTNEVQGSNNDGKAASSVKDPLKKPAGATPGNEEGCQERKKIKQGIETGDESCREAGEDTHPEKDE